MNKGEENEAIKSGTISFRCTCMSGIDVNKICSFAATAQDHLRQMTSAGMSLLKGKLIYRVIFFTLLSYIVLQTVPWFCQ